jgi:ribose 5-phosphate isomerase B
MRIALGADHAGFVLKQHLRRSLEQHGHEVVDVGTNSPDSCDYPDFAAAVAHEVAAGRAERGVLVCSTGVGMSIAANKVPGIRAALGTNTEEVYLVRSHNDANILTLGARYLDEAEADALVDTFLTTEFDGGRHARRLAKIAALERVETGQEIGG